jgi:hypothetical protein
VHSTGDLDDGSLVLFRRVAGYITLGRSGTMVVAFIAAFIVVPVVWHWFDFDRARSAAGSALALGVGCAVHAWRWEGWQIGTLVFFLASFLEFAVASIVGLVYWSFASAARTDYAERAKSTPTPGRRIALGGVGAVAISLTLAFVWLAQGIGTGSWPWTPRLVFGWCAFFILGVVAIAQVLVRRSRRSKQDAAT